jgi:hypothetical protein
MAISNNIINAYKKVVDYSALVFNSDYILKTHISMQEKCLFEILFMPESFSSITSPLSLALDVLGVLVVRLYLYSINDIPLIGMDYQRVGGKQALKDAIYPDGFSATFIEDEMGTVKTYFSKWLDLIATYDSSSREYYFNDNQDASKRTAIIIPQQRDVLPSIQWIKIDGIKIKTVSGFEFDHSSGEQQLLTIDFTCDNARIFGL